MKRCQNVFSASKQGGLLEHNGCLFVERQDSLLLSSASGITLVSHIPPFTYLICINSV